MTEKTLEVGEAQSAHERARAAEAEARKAREAEQARAVEERRRERALLEAGQVRARDLQQGERYWIGASQRVAQLLQGELGAGQQVHAAAALEGEARASLVQAQGDAQALERHHQRFVAEKQRAAELADDEDSLDRWAARRG